MKEPDDIGVKSHGRRYPWGEWFKHDLFTLKKGIDYEITTHGMVQMIRRERIKYGIIVSLKVSDTDIQVTVLNR